MDEYECSECSWEGEESELDADGDCPNCYCSVSEKENSDEYDVGDTVRLNSGGPLMTIEEVNNSILTCRWFTKKHKLKKSEFYSSEVMFDSNTDDSLIWYNCNSCDWHDTEDELDEDGDCPECGSSVEKEYENHCWNCGEDITSLSDEHCSSCNMYECSSCGSCFCNR